MIKKKKILNKFSKFVYNDFKKYGIMENRKKIEKNERSRYTQSWALMDKTSPCYLGCNPLSTAHGSLYGAIDSRNTDKPWSMPRLDCSNGSPSFYFISVSVSMKEGYSWMFFYPGQSDMNVKGWWAKKQRTVCAFSGDVHQPTGRRVSKGVTSPFIPVYLPFDKVWIFRVWS